VFGRAAVAAFYPIGKSALTLIGVCSKPIGIELAARLVLNTRFGINRRKPTDSTRSETNHEFKIPADNVIHGPLRRGV
jgi:hypothetical protein